MNGFSPDSFCFIELFMQAIRAFEAYSLERSFENSDGEHGSQHVVGQQLDTVGQHGVLAYSKQIGRIVDRAAVGTGSSSVAGGIAGGGTIGSRCGSGV